MLLLKVCLLIVLSTIRRYRFLYFIPGCCLVGLEPDGSQTRSGTSRQHRISWCFLFGFVGRVLWGSLERAGGAHALCFLQQAFAF